MSRIFCHRRSPLEYNRSVEATGGQLKTRAAILASCQLTSDIIEAARIANNALLRPWGISSPTPAERWEHRPIITDPQRLALCALIVENTTNITRSIQRQRQGKGLDPTFTAACTATVARTATRQALVELGYLQIRSPAIMST